MRIMMSGPSFISRFKKILLFGVMVLAVIKIMNYLYVDDTDDFTRTMMHAFYEEEENIDRLYLGSSHVFCDIDPFILDDENGDNNFNLASGNQQLIASYHLLVEADKRHDLDKVYLDLYYACTDEGQGNLHDYHQIPNSWNVLNQMKPSANKLTYMLDLSSPEYYYLTFMAFKRYTEELFHPQYVAKIVRAKQSDVWKDHEYFYKGPDGNEISARGEKGFRLDYRTPEYGRLSVKNIEEAPVDKDPIVPESMEYLIKITEYCKEHEIELTWIVCPMSELKLVRNGTYDNYIGQVSQLAAQYQIPYYDFNLCKREYLDLSPNDYWEDEGHLNTYGAEVFSHFLGDFLRAQEAGEDTYRDCFYGGYEEKIQDLQDEIFGLEILPSQEYERYLPNIPEEQWGEYVIHRLRFVTNAPAEALEVKIGTAQDIDAETEGKLQMIREGSDVYVIRSVHDQEKLNVEAKLKDSMEVAKWVQIDL